MMMPADGDDLAAAARIVDMGYPTVAPVLRDMMKWMRVANSPVADTFAGFFARLGEPALAAIAEGLRRDNSWLKHRIFTVILPKWSPNVVAQLRGVLAVTATHPDAYDNDVRSVALLVKLHLADGDWLKSWVDFKRKRWGVRDELLKQVEKQLGVDKME